MQIKSHYLIIILILVFSTIANSQNIHKALTKDGWTGGLAGILGWENFKTETSVNGQDQKAKVDGFNFVFTSRNGKIVETNAVFGFDIQWEEESRTTRPENNPTNQELYVKERIGFLGLWARYYLIIGGNFAWFPEGSAGYAFFKSATEFKDDIQANSTANSTASGFAYNVGLGLANFVSENVSFEVSARWQGGTLKGDRKNTDGSTNDLKVKLGNINLLFGFQIYLR